MSVVEEPLLYVRDGSRFVVYDAGLQHTPPIPVPRVLDEREQPVEDPESWDPDAVPTRERPVVRTGVARWSVYAPRCPRGRFRGCRARGCPGPS